MIEKCWLPLRAVVAVSATRISILGELLAVDILMALFTLGRRGLEIHVH